MVALLMGVRDTPVRTHSSKSFQSQFVHSVHWMNQMTRKKKKNR